MGGGTKDVILVGGTVGIGREMTKVGKKAQKKGECDGEDGSGGTADRKQGLG